MTIAFWMKAAQLILSLSILVLVHELGHFMFARLFKVRVDKFYMFFNWKFSIVRMKKISGKWQVRWFAPNAPDCMKPLLDENGDARVDKKGNRIMVPFSIEELPDGDWRKYPETTEWGIGWIPLGGYCKIAGMVDESMDPTVLNSEPKAWEYRSRPAWQRLFIITGGVLMNFVTAIVVYALMLFTWGKEYLPLPQAYMGYNYCQTALNNGFQNGDLIFSVDGDEILSEREAMEKIVIEGKTDVVVSRSGELFRILLPKNFGEQMLNAEEKGFMEVRVPFVVEKIMGMNTMLQSGDSVVGLAGKPMCAYQDIAKELVLHKGERLPIDFFRNGVLSTDTIELDENGKIGVGLKNSMGYFKTERQEYGFFAAFPAGWNLGVETLIGYIKQFRLVFTKAGAKSLGGFGAIGSLFPSMWDWQMFWNMTAFLSIILAFMNILPIPVLDGGYVLFILYELVTRRKPSDKFMEVALNIGMLLLFALLIFANGNDVFRLFR